MHFNEADQPDGRELARRALASAVVDYLRTHPRAMDTVSGIAEWWLPEYRVPIDTQLLGQALVELTRQGVLEQINAGEHKHYRLKRA